MTVLPDENTSTSISMPAMVTPAAATELVAGIDVPVIQPTEEWPVHTIVSGQTLGQVAEWYGTTVVALVSHNDLADPTIVEVGQQIEMVNSTRTPSPPTELLNSPEKLVYAEAITHWANYYGINPAVYRSLVWQESRWDNNAVSYVGAFGLSQLMPLTAASAVQQIAVSEGITLDPEDPEDNLRIGAWYLAQLKEMDVTGGDMWRTLVAYNQGPTALRKRGPYNDAIKYANIVLGKSALFVEGP